MNTRDVRAVLPVPKEPIDPGTLSKWTEIEKNIGTALPPDYKAFINTYGTGCIGGFLWPYNPFSENPFLNLLERYPGELAPLKELKGEFGDAVCPYPIFPEAGGLFPWGRTDNGDVLFWLTGASPQEWTVVVHEARSRLFEAYDLTATDFLTELMSGQIRSLIIPSESLDQEHGFESRG